MDHKVILLLVAASSALMHTTGAIYYTKHCAKKYKDISPQHTMCMVDKGSAVRLTEATKDAIVKQHNDFRADVSPTAGDMQKMVWDEDLAVVAAKWARMCGSHDSPTQRKVPSLPGIYVGQTMVAGYSNWNEAINAWHSEVNVFIYGVGAKSGWSWRDYGSYTQVVYAASTRIGCGQAKCPRNWYICNYAIGRQGNSARPYEKSTRSCSACPRKCDPWNWKLCDCGGKLCVNGGNLDLKTCSCSCPPDYKGDTCQTKEACPTRDNTVCGHWPASYCSTYSGVLESCPYMCGKCKHVCGGKVCKNGGTLDKQTCTCTCANKLYSGNTCEIVNCPTSDGSNCGNPNLWTQKHCEFPYVRDRCPYMCGICGKGCHKTCQNGGSMNYLTCECICRPDYKGDSCQDRVTFRDCPTSDAYTCDNTKLSPSDCMNPYVRSMCPYMCGVCKKEGCVSKTCQNGGSVNYITCKCMCTPEYEGDSCQNPVSCPNSDSSNCGNLKLWTPSYCEFPYVRNRCPYMCGICREMHDF